MAITPKKKRECRKMACPSFVIEGNIGVGKSTLLSVCEDNDYFKAHFSVFTEPLDQWQSVNGSKHNLLENFYADPKKNAYIFQNFVFITRFLQHQKAAMANCPRLLERSVWTDKFVFAAAVKETGLMTPLEGEVYDAWYSAVVETLPHLVPSAFIYLRADPKVCFGRLKTRNRDEESSVPLSYLQLLHNKHEKWFIEGSDAVEDTPTPSGVTQLRRLVGSRTHKNLDGVLVLVIDSNRHLVGEERAELREVVMDFVCADLKPCEEDCVTAPKQLRIESPTSVFGACSFEDKLAEVDTDSATDSAEDSKEDSKSSVRDSKISAE